MDLGIEGFIVAIFFLLPGFIATYVHISLTSDPYRSRSAFQETLGSLAASAPIFIFQLGILILLVVFIKPLHNDLDLIIKYSFQTFVSLNPIRIALYFLSWIFISFVLSIGYGFIDPIEKIVEWNQKRSGIYPHDFWYSALRKKPEELGFSSKSFLRVWLNSGECYAGWIEGFEPTSEMNESRYFLLVDCHRWYSSSDIQKGKAGEKVKAVLLKSSDVNSIDIWWEKKS